MCITKNLLTTTYAAKRNYKADITGSTNRQLGLMWIQFMAILWFTQYALLLVSQDSSTTDSQYCRITAAASLMSCIPDPWNKRLRLHDNEPELKNFVNRLYHIVPIIMTDYTLVAYKFVSRSMTLTLYVLFLANFSTTVSCINPAYLCNIK